MNNEFGSPARTKPGKENTVTPSPAAHKAQEQPPAKETKRRKPQPSQADIDSGRAAISLSDGRNNLFTWVAKHGEKSRRKEFVHELRTLSQTDSPMNKSSAWRHFKHFKEDADVRFGQTNFKALWGDMCNKGASFDWTNGPSSKRVKKETKASADQGGNGLAPFPIKPEVPSPPHQQLESRANSLDEVMPYVKTEATGVESQSMMVVSSPAAPQSMNIIRFPIASGSRELRINLQSGNSLVVDRELLAGFSSVVLDQLGAISDETLRLDTIDWSHYDPVHVIAVVMRVHAMGTASPCLLPGAILVAFRLGFTSAVVTFAAELVINIAEPCVSRQVQDPALRRELMVALAHDGCSVPRAQLKLEWTYHG
jgi:hypothetical protein